MPVGARTEHGMDDMEVEQGTNWKRNEIKAHHRGRSPVKKKKKTADKTGRKGRTTRSKATGKE